MNLFKRKEVWIVLILLGVLMINRITAIVNIKANEDGFGVEIEDIQIEEDLNSGEVEAVKETIKVDISGAVFNPGVYELTEGDRIEDVIKLAGGFTKEADINLINQADYIKDGQKIIILKTGESLSSVSGENRGPIDLNSASKEQLTTLSGVGEKTAEKIILYRQKNGAFKSVDELVNVPGIGESKLEDIRSEIIVK